MRSTIMALVFIVLGCSAAAAQHTPASSHERAVLELFAVLELEKTTAETMKTVMSPMGMEDNPMAGIMEDFMKEFMPWSRLEPEYVRLYAELFTEPEIRELIAFYRTPVGRKMVEAGPTMTARMAEISQRLMMPHMGELQQRIMQRMGGGN